MGYRSEVTIVFYTRNGKVPFPALKLWIDENYPLKQATEEWDVKLDTDDKTYLLLTYRDVKWYDGYDHVDAVKEALHRFTETFDSDDHEYGNAAYEMVRLGEEVEDIEEQRSDYSDYYLGVQRTVHFDG